MLSVVLLMRPRAKPSTNEAAYARRRKDSAGFEHAFGLTQSSVAAAWIGQVVRGPHRSAASANWSGQGSLRASPMVALAMPTRSFAVATWGSTGSRKWVW